MNFQVCQRRGLYQCLRTHKDNTSLQNQCLAEPELSFPFLPLFCAGLVHLLTLHSTYYTLIPLPGQPH